MERLLAAALAFLIVALSPGLPCCAALAADFKAVGIHSAPLPIGGGYGSPIFNAPPEVSLAPAPINALYSPSLLVDEKPAAQPVVAARAEMQSLQAAKSDQAGVFAAMVEGGKGRKSQMRGYVSIEALVGAAAGLMLAGAVSYSIESKREKVLPLGFSEIHQIEIDAEREGKTIGPNTRFYSSTNETAMKIFETWNLANEPIFVPNVPHRFASMIEEKVDSTMKVHHYELLPSKYDGSRGFGKGLIPLLPEQAQAALAGELKPFVGVMREVEPVNQSFEDAWTHRWRDNYHTEQDCTTDSKGNQTCTSRQVYDDTDHWYDYRPASGERASAGLDALLHKYDPLHFTEKLLTASHTNAEGEYAAEKSQKQGDKKWTDENSKESANKWANGSNLAQNMPVIFAEWSAAHSNADQWRAAKQGAHNHAYNNRNRGTSDPGPFEYQVAKRAQRDGEALQKNIYEIAHGMEYVGSHAPGLERDIREIIAVELDHKPGDGKMLMKRIMETAKESYRVNFKGGFDVDRFRWGLFFLWSILGAAIGAGLGYAIDQLGNKLGFYRSSSSRNRYY